jgi:hypothetical protein
MSTLPYPTTTTTTYLGSSARLTPFRNGQTSLVNPRQQSQRYQRVKRQAQVTRADGFQNLINQISEVVTNSPVNNLKKGIAKVQAGDYDEAAIRAKVDNYLNDNPVSTCETRWYGFADPQQQDGMYCCFRW